jgi:hypothetical protein
VKLGNVAYRPVRDSAPRRIGDHICVPFNRALVEGREGCLASDRVLRAV